jgi:hypothetical protein
MDKKKQLLIALLAAVVAACVVFVPTPVSAAETINIGSASTFTTTAINPNAEVSFSGLTTSVNTIYVQQSANGVWSSFGSCKLSPSSTSGKVNLFDGKSPIAAGTYTLRLASDNNIPPAAWSPSVTVTVNKNPTSFVIGDTAHVGTFHVARYVYSSDDPYYAVKKDVAVNWIGDSSETVYAVEVQRKEGAEWKTIGSKSPGIWAAPTITATFDIEQKTPATTQYRFLVKEGNYVTGGVSGVFTISGKKQSPGLSVDFSKKSQKYKKGGVKVSIKTTGAKIGTAVIYDGSKKLKTLSITGGFIKGKYSESSSFYTLSKKLKKGKHKIKVVFTAKAQYTLFYNKQTSKVTTIKVK